mgnify:CR=1 FL=1
MANIIKAKEKYGLLNKGFATDTNLRSSLEDGQAFGNLRITTAAANSNNAADRSNVFKGYVLAVTETPIPGGLLEVMKAQAQPVKIKDFVQVYVRIPEIHAYLPIPNSETDLGVQDHALCVAPKSDSYKFGTPVSVQFNDVYSTSFGIVLTTSPLPATVEGTYTPGEVPPFPLNDANRKKLALLGTRAEVFEALGMDFRKYIAGEWETFEKLKPALRKEFGGKGPSPKIKKELEELLTAFKMEPKCFWMRLWMGESGLKPAGIFGQYLNSDPNPNLVDLSALPASQGGKNCSGVGIGQVVSASFFKNGLNLVMRAPHHFMVQPIPYGVMGSIALLAAIAANVSRRKTPLPGHNKNNPAYNAVAFWTNTKNVPKGEKRYAASLRACKGMSEQQVVKAFSDNIDKIKEVLLAYKLSGAMDLGAPRGFFIDHPQYKKYCKKKVGKIKVTKYSKFKFSVDQAWDHLCKKEK